MRDSPIHFTCVHHHLLYLRGSPGIHAAQWPVCVHVSISFIKYKKKKKKTAGFVTKSLACFSRSAYCTDSNCVTDSFGPEPAQFAKQVIPLCS